MPSAGRSPRRARGGSVVENTHCILHYRSQRPNAFTTLLRLFGQSVLSSTFIDNKNQDDTQGDIDLFSSAQY